MVKGIYPITKWRVGKQALMIRKAVPYVDKDFGIIYTLSRKLSSGGVETHPRAYGTHREAQAVCNGMNLMREVAVRQVQANNLEEFVTWAKNQNMPLDEVRLQRMRRNLGKQGD